MKTLLLMPSRKLVSISCRMVAFTAAAVLLSASMCQERVGLHVYIISERVAGQVFVDKRVEGPFRGTSTAGRRERERLVAEAASKAEVVRDQVSTYEPGNCIAVYKSANNTLFTATIRESSDMDRRLRTLRQGKSPVTIVFDKQCL